MTDVGANAMAKLGGVTLIITLSLAKLATDTPLSVKAEVLLVLLPAVVVMPVET